MSKNKADFDEVPQMMYFVMPGELNADGEPVRTKQSHPYSYDPIVTFMSRKVPTGSLYTDRLTSWYGYDTVHAMMQKHFGEQGDYWNSRSITKNTAFLRELLDKPTLCVTRVEEQCNQATGYPVWFIAYAEGAN